MLVTSIFSFSHSVCKSSLFQGRENQRLIFRIKSRISFILSCTEWIILRSKSRTYTPITILSSVLWLLLVTTAQFFFLPEQHSYFGLAQTHHLSFYVILPLYHTIPTFHDPKRGIFWKHCWKRRKCWLTAFSPSPTMFSTPPIKKKNPIVTFILLSADPYNSIQSRICRLVKS